MNAPACVRRKDAQVRSAVGKLPQLMRNRAHIASGRDMHRKARRVAIERIKREAVNRDPRRLDRHLFSGSRELVRGHAADLLRRKHRRDLVDLAMESLSEQRS